MLNSILIISRFWTEASVFCMNKIVLRESYELSL